LTVTYGFSQSGLGTIRGSVVDKESKEFIPNSVITVKQNGSVRANATTDFDGKFEYSFIITVDFSTDEYGISIYPNPTNDGFYIKCLPQGEVAIYSISGQYIKYQKFDAQTKIDLSEMESGVYLVQVEGKGVAFISKMD
jgi:hypothetical protein